MQDILNKLFHNVWTYVVLALFGGVWAAAGSDLYSSIFPDGLWVQIWASLSDFLKSAAMATVTPISVPVFVLAISSVITLASVALLIWKFWPAKNSIDWNDINSIEKNFRSFEWRGLRWEWDYYNLSVLPPKPICPLCHADMRLEIFDRGQTHVRVSCPNDDSQAEFGGDLWNGDQVREAARSEVLRQIRSKANVMEFY